MISKNIVILYHGNCSDGFGGAWAAWKKFGNKAEYIGVQYSEPVPEGLTNKEVYLIDFTYKLPQMRKMMTENKRVTCIDHHITAEFVVKLTKDFLFSNDHSGCVLAWQYFHPKKPVPQMLFYIEDGDIGKWSIKGTDEIHCYLRAEDQDFKNWNKLATKIEKPQSRKKILEVGAAIKKFESRLVYESVKEDAELVELDGIKTLAVNSSNFPTNIGKALVAKRPPMGIIWNKMPGMTYVSLRSNGTVNVAKLAEKYGGGGHERAAGFSIPDGTPLPWKIIK